MVYLTANLLNSILHFHLFFLFSTSILILFWHPTSCLKNTGNETDKLALLNLKSQIDSDPSGVLSSWNDSVKLCRWQGVICGRKHQRVTSLNLQGLSLSGTISPYIGNLTFLRSLQLPDNRFQGEIPWEIGHLFRLRYLNLTNNTFVGEIPVSISNCSELQTLIFRHNSLAGKIPDEIGSLKRLVLLSLGSNNLTGKFPRSIGNVSSLQHVIVSSNNLWGNIPNELGKLTGLIRLGMGSNNLMGIIPSTLYNVSSVTVISIADNQLKGSLSPNIGLTLPNLQILEVGMNQFSGTIPVSLTNGSQLQLFGISTNCFTGQVPTNLGYLNKLQRLNLESNFLSQDLGFMKSLLNCSNLKQLYMGYNNFSGILPANIVNLSTLIDLGLGGNYISGRVPMDIGNLANLYVLGMEANLISGSIPTSLGLLKNLQILLLHTNLLSGEIPTSLSNISTHLSELWLGRNRLSGNLTSNLGLFKYLKVLDIAENNFTGIIPQQILDLTFLSYILNLSENSLTGTVAPEIGHLKSLFALDVANNKLSGEIPPAIGECLSMEFVYMQGNLFNGSIPSSIASLRGIKIIDLSRNNLSRGIPKELEKLSFLQYLDLSFNNLEGEVPRKGVFSNVSAFSVVGNANLCGGIPELKLPVCPVEQKHKRSPLNVILATTISSIVLFVTIVSFCVFIQRKSKKNPSSFSPSIVDSLPRISYGVLLQATEGFSSDNFIGQGSFGSVYKGILDMYEKRIFAVKVLNLQQHGASKSFIAECRALKDIKHRNLVKILTYCSGIDFKGNDFKALVYDFMVNGSLEKWLHQSWNLNFLQRLRIAIDVSSALHYLHENCEVPVIHCDLKPSNILLDDDMTAHVGDFGLARLVSQTSNNPSEGQTSSIGIKGTIGYMPPEYGMGSQATTAGDVYSFGIILLEMFTGKRPTDEIFTDGMNLHSFVESKLTSGRRIIQVLDPKLITTGDVEWQDEDNVLKFMISILRIGLACSAELPEDRMNMRDATRKLNVIMDAFSRITNSYGGQAPLARATKTPTL